MKIIVTGGLGHISRPLTQELVRKGHQVTVISSKAERALAIEALGAVPAIGTLEDVNFLAGVFTGADAVYTMIPPNHYFDANVDLMNYVVSQGRRYAEAIRRSGVRRLVHLSSVGAHAASGTGIIVTQHEVEKVLSLLTDVEVSIMRPCSFYYNLLPYIPMIKAQGFIAASYGGEDKTVWVAPEDIAAAIVEELEMPSRGHTIRYVASEELTCSETAAIIGKAIGKPDLQWLIAPGDVVQAGMISHGMNPGVAAGLVEMYSAMHSGLFFEDYYLHRPPVMGKVKCADYAITFAEAYNNE